MPERRDFLMALSALTASAEEEGVVGQFELSSNATISEMLQSLLVMPAAIAGDILSV